MGKHADAPEWEQGRIEAGSIAKQLSMAGSGALRNLITQGRITRLAMGGILPCYIVGKDNFTHSADLMR